MHHAATTHKVHLCISTQRCPGSCLSLLFLPLGRPLEGRGGGTGKQRDRLVAAAVPGLVVLDMQRQPDDGGMACACCIARWTDRESNQANARIKTALDPLYTFVGAPPPPLSLVKPFVTVVSGPLRQRRREEVVGRKGNQGSVWSKICVNTVEFPIRPCCRQSPMLLSR